MRNCIIIAGAIFPIASLCISASAPAGDKNVVKRERVQLSLPIIIDAPLEEAPRSVAFRTGEFWGGQPAHYRSAVTVDSAVPVPEIGPFTIIIPGDRLIELQADSKSWRGSLYCRTEQRTKKLPPALLCLADRDGDGRMDQLWAGVAASLRFVIPYPELQSLRAIEPTGVRPFGDQAALALQIGFYVSGTNPLLGQHHFYSMLSEKGEVGYVMSETHKAVSIKALPKELKVGGGTLRLTNYRKPDYEATISAAYPTGEQSIVSQYPTQTIFVSIPG